MCNKRIQDFIVYEEENVFEAYWRYCKYRIPFMVLDKNNKFVGLVGEKDFNDKIQGGV